MTLAARFFRIAPVFILAWLTVACTESGPALKPEETIRRREIEAWKATAYAPGRAEAIEHRLTDLEPIVVDLKPEDRLSLIPVVDIAGTVGADGQVVSARVVSGYATNSGTDQSAQEALAQVRALRFEPFVRDGRPVTANLEIFVPLVEVRASPPPSLSFPEGPLAGATIELKRTQCFGPCPAYSVTISGTGDVTWRGDANVAVRGEANDRIDPRIVEALLVRARSAGFFDLRDIYRADVTDGPTFTITVTLAGRTKRVEDYDGALVGMPYEVTLLEQAIDRAARTARRIGPDQPYPR